LLVLTRKVGEGIAIGDDIKIVIMQIKGKQVRIGIKASPATAVHREEIYQKVQDENLAASKTTTTIVSQASLIIGNNISDEQAPLKTHHKHPGRTKTGPSDT
jgi:carbon storage regulator